MKVRELLLPKSVYNFLIQNSRPKTDDYPFFSNMEYEIVLDGEVYRVKLASPEQFRELSNEER